MDKSTYTGTMSGTLLTIFYNLPKEKLVQTAALAFVGAVVSFLVSLGLKWIVKVCKRGSWGCPLFRTNIWTKINYMKALPTRVCIYPKDIQRITGKSERYGRILINHIRKAYSKKAHQFVTVQEFCAYSGIGEELVKQQLDDWLFQE